MTTADDVNRDKTKVPEEFIFCSVCLIVLVPNSMSKLFTIDVSLHVSLHVLKMHTCMQTNNWVLVFMFLVRYSLLFSSEIILKQLFASGSVNMSNNPLDFVSGITITAEIHARSLVKFYCQYADRHMNLKFMGRVSERERAIRQFVIVKIKLMSVFNASVLLLTMNFVITLSTTATLTML